MKEQKEFAESIEEILHKDPRYNKEAYTFVMAALGYTQAKIGEIRHVTGQELLAGIREYALQEFGVMAKTVFNHWGIRSSEDFGNIVFNMVNDGLLNKREEDSIEDFKNGYDFKEALNPLT